MWFALRHVRSGRTRFTLFAALVALVSGLIMLLTGLGLGLGDASISGMNQVDADAVVEQNGVRLSIGRSLVDLSTVEKAAAVKGVKSAEPLGLYTVSVRGTNTGKGPADDIALNGAREGSWVLPDGSQSMNANTAVADTALEDLGYKVGDTISVEPSKRKLTIGAFVDAGTYSHLPMVFVPVKTWQQVRFGPVDGVGQIPPGAYKQVSAVALQLTDTKAPAIETALANDNLTVATGKAATAATPGYKEETGTISLMVFFLYLIGALLVATFFWNATVQRTGEFAVMRAIGAGRSRMVREHLVEVSLIALTGLVAAVILSTGISALLPQGVPFLLPFATVISTAIGLFIISLIAGAISLRKVIKVDPLLALGRNV